MNEKIQSFIGMEKIDTESWVTYFDRANASGQLDQKALYKILSFIVEELNAKRETKEVSREVTREDISTADIPAESYSVQSGTLGTTEEISSEVGDTEVGQYSSEGLEPNRE